MRTDELLSLGKKKKGMDTDGEKEESQVMFAV